MTSVVTVWCVEDDVCDSASVTRPCAPHKCSDVQHLLPLSVEAQFVHNVIDRVSVYLSHQKLHCVVGIVWTFNVYQQ